MRLFILWAGIAAFVWIGLFPPTIWRHGIDPTRLLCDWAIIVVVTGGLLWSEPWLRTRLWPWVRAKRRAIVRVLTAGVLLCLVAVLCYDASVRLQHTEATQSNVLDEVFGASEGPIRLSDTPSDGTITPEQARAELRRREALRESQPDMATRQQINNFFSAADMAAYDDFYGKTTGQYEDWSHLTPGQKANRIEVCERAQLILDGGAVSGTEMSTAEALERAHLSYIGGLTSSGERR